MQQSSLLSSLFLTITFSLLIFQTLSQSQNSQPSLQAQNNCTEMYPRLFFTSSPSKMIIKFNTNSPCARSYVTIQQQHSITKFYCVSQMLKITQLQTFIQYIQNCTVNINTSVSYFKYVVYGGSPASAIKGGSAHRPYIRAQIQSQNYRHSSQFTVNVPKKDESFNMVVVADWGPMLINTYQPVYPSLKQDISMNKSGIHAMMIVGDVAYDLSSKQCKQYQIFMQELSVVSPCLPIIPIFGNHQSYQENNFNIFMMSFQVYNLSGPNKVQAYQFWNFKVVTFDPFKQIYAINTEKQYDNLKNALLTALAPKTTKKHQKQQQTQQFVVLSSHYPLVCSQQVFHCQQTLKTLSSLLIQISLLKQVDLYIGAHMHQYERIVSFYNGSFILNKKGPYKKGQMASIVQGVAGNDIGIIDQDYSVKNFSVTHTYNKTGYGILRVFNLSSSPYAKFTHYTTISDNVTIAFDEVVFQTQKKQQKNDKK